MKVNICMIAYNHQDYIAEAIEGILAQVTAFDIELIIGEDNSKDRTKEISREYALKFPGKIKLVTSETNVGMAKNFMRAYKACDGKYIAFCEGDDYWTDPYKLQKQIDFLETNTSYSACFHNVMMKEDRNGKKKEWILHNSLPKDSFDTADILGPWFVPSVSVVFVNYPDFVLPDWFFNCRYGDLPFMLLLSLHGKFKYIDEVMGVYRLHDTGMTTKDIGYDKIILMIYIYESFNIHTNYQFKEKVREAMVYEIDRHVPKEDMNDNSTKEEKNIQPLIKKSIRKIKNLLQNKP